ncbi:MAG: SDR family NAD(P)-dependent oxidoreductase [Myxococcota bacterium]
MATFRERYGPWAVVAGASEGLGAEFARQLASRGLNVVVVARRAELLTTVKVELESTHQIAVQAVPLDLAAHDAAERLVEATRALDVGLLVYNAALSPQGEFTGQRLEDNLRAIDLNVRTPTALAHHFAARFRARGKGGVVLLSSLTAFQGSPFLATYGATKAYNLALAEGLWFELERHGVDVLAVCAGATRTPGLLRAAPKGAPGMLEPSAVVAASLDALGRGPLTIPGAFNRFASFLLRRLLPRRATIAIMGDQTRKLQLPS